MKRSVSHRVDTVELGDFNPLNKSVKSTDVIVGGLVLGLGGGALLKKALLYADATLKKSNPAGGLPAFVLANSFAVGSLLASALGYFAGEKVKNVPYIGGSHSEGAYVGGVLVGGAMLAKALLAPKFPAFSDVDVIRLGEYAGYGGYGGVLMDDGVPMNGYGLLQSDDGGMGRLAAASMEPDYDGIAELAAMP